MLKRFQKKFNSFFVRNIAMNKRNIKKTIISKTINNISIENSPIWKVFFLIR
jgi:hypothetical protein